MTSISEGFADLLGDGWATERTRLGTIARRFVSDADDADAVVEHAIDRLDASRFGEDADGTRKAIDALELSVRRTAVDAIDAGAAPTVPTDLDEEAFAAFALPSSDGFVTSPMREALGALPSTQRDVLVARIDSGMPPAKAAAAVGIDERAAAGAIGSARRALRAEVRAVVCEREGGEHALHARSSGQAAKAHLAGCQFCRDVRHPVGPPPRTARRPIALAATAGAPIALAAGAAAATAAAAPTTPGEPLALDPATTPMAAALTASAAPSEPLAPAATTGGAERAHVPSVRRRRRRRGAIALAAAVAVAAATTVAVALSTQDVQQGSVDDRADGQPADVSAAPVAPDDEESTGGVEAPAPSTDATAPDASEAPAAAEHDDAAADTADDSWSSPASDDEPTTPGGSAPPTWSAPQPTTAPAPAPTTGPAPAPAPTTPTQPPAPAPTQPPAPPAPQPPSEDADPPLLPGLPPLLPELPPLLPELPPILPGLPPLLQLIVP